MSVILRKWGNSPAVRIPVSAMREARFEIDQAVTVRAVGRGILIEPAQPEYDIVQLVAGITSKNRHPPIASGADRGAEAVEW